jgi:hypothetical protein
VKAGRGAWAAAGAALLALGGCDFLDNLIDQKQVTRAGLEVRLVDAWTGTALRDGECRDSLSGAALPPDGQGWFRLPAAATGPYAIHCERQRYYPASLDTTLTYAGASFTVKLARKGGSDWYPDPEKAVAVPLAKNGSIRYPIGLDWRASPADDSDRFRYEWIFRRTPQLNRGIPDGRELPRQAFSPRFRDTAAEAKGIREGEDTVVLNVYSLLRGDRDPYLVASDTTAFRWVRNRKPTAIFPPESNNQASIKVNCPEQSFATLRLAVAGGDSDGTCKTIRVWALHAPSLAQFDTVKKDYVVTGRYDTTFACGPGKHYLFLKVGPPAQPGRPHLKTEGSWEYDDTLAVEVTDDNGESDRDTLTFLSYTNAPPLAALHIPKPSYFEDDPIPIKVSATDSDGYINRFTLYWQGKKDSINHSVDYVTDFPPSNTSDHIWPFRFSEADTFKVFSRILDDCYGIYDTPKADLIIEKDSAPIVEVLRIRKDTAEGGSQLRITFDLRIRDKEAGEGRDSVTLITIAWNGSVPEIVSERPDPLDFHDLGHSFPLPFPAASIPIRVLARDAHGKSGEASFRVPLP